MQRHGTRESRKVASDRALRDERRKLLNGVGLHGARPAPKEKRVSSDALKSARLRLSDPG
jgi:hypothetical protein